MAALSYLIVQQQDKLGLYVFGAPGGDLDVPPRARTSHLTDLLGVIDKATAGGDGEDDSPATALDRIGELARRKRALIVRASDLFDTDDRTLAALRRLRAQKHDVAVLHVLAPEERTFPFEGLTLFEALESDHRLLANPAAIRKDYLERMDAFLARVVDELTNAGVDYHLCPTDRAVEDTLLDFLVRRS